MNILQNISLSLGLSESEVLKFLATAPHRYKRYHIPKRNNKGYRTIAQPSKEVKYFQKFVAQMFFKKLPVHEACTAYKLKSGIKDNALRHASNQYLLKMDFRKFFPSITVTDFTSHIKKYCPEVHENNNLDVILKLFFWSNSRYRPLELSIGAPTSPHISNTILLNFDNEISKYCKDNEIIYTRYADDITFSTNTKGVLFSLPEKIDRILEDLVYPRLTINTDKTVFLSKKHNRHITGVTISNTGNISLGRKRKRFIKSQVYKFSLGFLEEKDVLSLKGHLAFSNDIEPEFIDRLKAKYGKSCISAIYSYMK